MILLYNIVAKHTGLVKITLKLWLITTNDVDKAFPNMGST